MLKKLTTDQIKAIIILILLVIVGCVVPVVICDILRYGWPPQLPW